MRANVTQKEVMNLSVGQPVTARFLNNKSYTGTIRYIASVADEGTNTFKIEALLIILIVSTGFSTQLDINYDTVSAVRLSPAFLALGDAKISVKTIDSENKVVFTKIDIVKSEQSGVWLAGLASANVITLGQGFFRGDTVSPVFADSQGRAYMRNIIEASLNRSRTVLSLFIFLLIAGWVTYQTIPKEANPDVTIPVIYVSIVHDGISPEDAERLLIRPMEIELRAIEGVKEMTATASEGHASVTLEFLAGTKPKEALADVRDKVSLLAKCHLNRRAGGK